ERPELPVTHITTPSDRLGLYPITEMLQDRPPPARLALDEPPDLSVLAPAVVLGLRLIDLVDEEHVQALVAVLGEQHAARLEPVAPRAAGLLVVRLERGGHHLV